MTDVTVKQFATVVGIPVDRLLEQFTEAGIAVIGADATITEKQKVDLLTHLRKSHGSRVAQGVAEPKKITLKRKTHSEIKMTGGMAGQVKTVSIEVRKRRTYVKRSLVEEEAPRPREPEMRPEAPVLAVPVEEVEEVEERLQEESLQLQKAEEARRQAEAEEEARRQAEEEARRQAAAEEEARRQAEEEARRQAEEEARRQAEEAARRQAEQETRRRPEPDHRRRPLERPALSRPVGIAARGTAEAGPAMVQPRIEAGEPVPAEARARKHPGPVLEAKASKKRVEPQARAVGKARAETGAANIPVPRRDEEQEEERFPQQRRGDLQQVLDKADRRKPKKGKGAKSPAPALLPRHGFAKPTAPMVREVIIPETISVADLAQKMSVKATEVIKNVPEDGIDGDHQSDDRSGYRRAGCH